MKAFLLNKFNITKIIQNFCKVSLTKKLGYVLLIILVIFVFSVSFSPLNKISEYRNLVELDSIWVEKFDSTYNYTEIAPLSREKAYKEALLKLSTMDSIQLIVNLHDSIVAISIKGVIIHVTPIKSIKLDLLLKRLPNMEYIKLFSQPVHINSQYATIVKEPIVVRQAPKDTIEAALNAYQPDTLVQNPAFLQLQLDYGINLIFEQDNNFTGHDKWTRFTFKSKLKLENIFKQLSRFFSFKKQEYNPSIVIKMPVNDLRAVYRALPVNAFVVIYY